MKLILTSSGISDNVLRNVWMTVVVLKWHIVVLRSGWMTRICRVPDAEQNDVGSDSFYLPVFAFVFTKFRKMPAINPVSSVS